MKVNLGCGPDIKPGYLNVDFRELPGVFKADLSKLPWSWAKDGEHEEVLMLDFLEHFPYRQTVPILQEVWRILQPGGRVEIQVPDLDHCARAASWLPPFLCNRCGWEYPNALRNDFDRCGKCGQSWDDCAKAAIHRLYGGQDYEGNWHFTAFTNIQLTRLLQANGFTYVQELERAHQYANWNFKLEARKGELTWEEQ